MPALRSDPSPSPPAIATVPEGAARPLWSVMIPTYNCAVYLSETLASVLAQAPAAEVMQIEVIDDCSTRDDPEAVVRELGQGRVAFFRQPQNRGAIGNFNTCLARSRGQLVHLLHGDDMVEPGFYEAIDRAASTWPTVGLLATRATLVDAEGSPFRVSDRLPQLEHPSADTSPFFYRNPLRTPSVVVRRDVYEATGGFREELVHAADWEMWTRAVGVSGGVMIDRLLARYRDFALNDTARLLRTGENLRDLMRVQAIFAARYAGFDSEQFLRQVRLLARRQVTRFRELGDPEAAGANLDILRQLPSGPLPIAQRLKELFASIPFAMTTAVRLRQRYAAFRR